MQDATAGDFEGAVGAALAANDKSQAELWLRQALAEHVRLTASPKARRLLQRSSSAFALVRVEPVNLPCSIEQTWSPVLARWRRRDKQSMSFPVAIGPEDSESAGQIIH